MTQLEVSMDMGRQSIYNAFGDKRELFLRALERYTRWNATRLADSLLEAGAGLEAIRSFFESMLELMTPEGSRRGCLVANSILELGDSDPGVVNRCQANQQQVLRGFEHALSNAVRDGDLPVSLDVGATATMLMSQTYGMSVLSKAGMSKSELASGIRELISRLK